MSLEDLNPNWDNNTIDYDLQEHNWPKFWLEIAQQKFPQIQSLEKVHQVLSATELSDLGAYLQSVCDNEEFINRVDAYYNSVVPGLIDQEDWMIQRYFTVRMVIPNQQATGRLLQFHKDEWTGNGLGILTVWTPITDCYETNSMQIMSCDDSERITEQCYNEKWSYDRLQEESAKHCFPVTLKQGQAHLFQQHHIHGNFNNETNITRWSMDGRILPKGGEYYRKLPGGYFRFIGEKPDIRPIDSSKTYISYAGWNNKWSGGIPLPMQRATINQYCTKYGIKINDYQFENEFLDWYPALEKFITGFNIDAIVLCSIYSLPDDPFRRNTLLNLAIQHNVELHFANELCSIRQDQDINHIEKILGYKI